MMKKIITGLLMLFLLVVSVACAKEAAPPPPSMPSPIPTPEPAESTPVSESPTVIHRPPGPADLPLQVTTIPGKYDYLPEVDYYLPVETIKIEIDFVNIGPDTITLNQFPPEIWIVSRADEMVRLFGAGAEELHLEPGATKTYNLTWDQRDENGKLVSPGRYHIDIKNVYYLRGGDPVRATRANFGDIARICIQYPQGAIEKTIEPNQSQTVNGITITLERVELSVEGARFCCFAVPPGYTPSQSIPEIMAFSRAEYSFDGIAKDAGFAGYGTRGDGIKLIWGSPDRLLDPVPADAKELTFTITRFGDVEGPWEFRVPLE